MSGIARVVKVGGSLFSMSEMPDRVNAWMGKQAPGVTIFIGGGGELVAPLRAAHQRFGLNEEASHWLAVRAMTVTSRLLAKLLNVELVERFDVVEQLVQTGRDMSCVLDVEAFLRAREPEMDGHRLPWDWSCTSDSIAARVAEGLRVSELVVMKSVGFPPGMALTDVAAQGLLDRHFAVAVEGIPSVRWVNLATEPPLERQIKPRN